MGQNKKSGKKLKIETKLKKLTNGQGRKNAHAQKSIIKVIQTFLLGFQSYQVDQLTHQVDDVITDQLMTTPYYSKHKILTLFDHFHFFEIAKMQIFFSAYFQNPEMKNQRILESSFHFVVGWSFIYNKVWLFAKKHFVNIFSSLKNVSISFEIS